MKTDLGELTLEDIGAAITRRRDTLAKTQAELSGMASIHWVTMSRIESGKVDFKVSTLVRLCEALSYSPGKLFALAVAMKGRKDGPARRAG